MAQITLVSDTATCRRAVCYPLPVDLTDKEIQRFIEAWEKDFGEGLSKEEPQLELSRLLNFLYTLAEAFPRELTEEE